MRLNPLLVALALVASVLAVQAAQANFGDALGFSGRSGVTCIACHTISPVGYTPATAVLDGLPAAWEPGTTYSLTMRVDGGPAAMPAPQPQGGFDLASDAGLFVLQAGTEPLMRVVAETEVVYLPDGVLQRQWAVDWVAPGLDVEPAPVQFWLAVVSANGNHLVAAGLPDGGERFDSPANMTVIVPASDAAWAAWRALPLLAPSAQVAVDDRDVRIEGRHADGNATRLAWRLDGAPWQQRDTGSEWRIVLAQLEPGPHTLRLRSEGAQRTSPETTLTFSIEGVLGPLTPKQTPAPSGAAILLVLAALALALRKSTP